MYKYESGTPEDWVDEGLYYRIVPNHDDTTYCTTFLVYAVYRFSPELIQSLGPGRIVEIEPRLLEVRGEIGGAKDYIKRHRSMRYKRYLFLQENKPIEMYK